MLGNRNVHVGPTGSLAKIKRRITQKKEVKKVLRRFLNKPKLFPSNCFKMRWLGYNFVQFVN